MQIGDLVRYCDSSEIPVHVAQNFSATIGVVVETCPYWKWAKIIWNNDDCHSRKHYFYQLEVISENR